MLSPRWRKVLMDIVGNKTRTLLVVLSVAVGVFAVGTISGTKAVLGPGLTDAYVAVNPAHAQISTDPFDDELVQTVAHMRGVSAAEGRRSFSVRLKVGPSEIKNLQLTAIADFHNMAVNIVYPEEGAWPPGPRELLVERSTLDMMNAKVGDMVTVALGNGAEKQMRLAGTAHYINAPPGKIGGSPFGFISMETAEWLGADRSYTSLNFTVAEHPEDKEHIREIAAQVRAKVERSGRTVYYTYIPDPFKHPADQIVQSVLLVLQVLGLLSLFASSFLVVNTISAVLAQQVRHIGMMKAVGARANQIMGMYFVMVVGFGVMALAVALPLGALGAYLFTRFLAGLLNFDLLSFRLPASIWIEEVAVGLVVPALAALAPVISGSRISVLKAVSDFGIGQDNGKRGLIDRLLERFHFLSRPMLLSLRNTFRRKGRLTLTLLTLTLSGSIFVGVFCVQSSLMKTMDDALAYWQYDTHLYFRQAYRLEEVQREVSQQPGVVKLEPWQEVNARRIRPDGTESDNLFLQGLPPQTKMVVPQLLEGRWLLPEDENAVVLNTEVTRNEKDLKVGDQVTLKVNNRETTFTVVGLVKGIMTGPIAYGNLTYVSDLTSQTGRVTAIRVVTETHDLKSVSDTARQLKDELDKRGLKVSGWGTIAAERENVAFQFNILVVFLLVMAVLLAAVGGLGLMGTMSINVLERTREIGVIRAIGASNGAVLRLFLVEGMIIGLLSWMLGVVVAYPFSKLMANAIGVAMLRTPLSYVFSVSGALIWLGLVVLISFLATLMPAWRAARLTVRDVLAYQ